MLLLINSSSLTFAPNYHPSTHHVHHSHWSRRQHRRCGIFLSFGSTHSNGASLCPSPASSLTSLPGDLPSPLLSPLNSPLERESPSPVPVVNRAGSASESTSTNRTCTQPLTRSRIPQVRIRKLEGMASGAPPKSRYDAGSSTSQGARTIPKPEGENSRPNQGGYTLSKVLGWSTKEYRDAQVCSLIYAHILHLNSR